MAYETQNRRSGLYYIFFLMELWRTVCKETWLLNDAATLEKLPGVDIAVEHGLQPTGTGYSAEISYTGKKNNCVSAKSLFQRWQYRLSRPSTHRHGPSYAVNPLKRHHDSPSFTLKLLISRKVVSEIVCFTKSCQISLSPESCLEKPWKKCNKHVHR